MDDIQLERSLQGTGKRVFVDYYELFRDKSVSDASYVVNSLVVEGVSNEDGAKMRVGFAKRVFLSGREKDALEIVSKSPGVSAETRAKAKLLYDAETIINSKDVIVDIPNLVDIAKPEAVQGMRRVPFTEKDQPRSSAISGVSEPLAPAEEERTSGAWEERQSVGDVATGTAGAFVKGVLKALLAFFSAPPALTPDRATERGKARAEQRQTPEQGDILKYISDATVSELLALYATTLDELREREIVRSANGPGGDYAELLFVQAFGWTRAKNSVAGYDAIDAADMRYQVKSRRLHHPTTSRQLSALRNFHDTPFDFLAGVLFNKDYSVMRAAIIPYNVIQARFSKHTNSSIFFLEDRIWNLPGVRDVTLELRSAATNLDA
jgi:hypothetical protein